MKELTIIKGKAKSWIIRSRIAGQLTGFTLRASLLDGYGRVLSVYEPGVGVTSVENGHKITVPAQDSLKLLPDRSAALGLEYTLPGGTQIETSVAIRVYKNLVP